MRKERAFIYQSTDEVRKFYILSLLFASSVIFEVAMLKHKIICFSLVIDILIFLKVKSSSEQIHNLQDRIHDLQNDLEMSKMVQKQMKHAAHHSEMEKRAYQKFVSEMLLALSQKGIARIIDGEGKEASYCYNVYKQIFSYLLYFVYISQHSIPVLQ
jgi:hypothetical protein